MKILTSTPDAKISANNHLLEISIGEYAEIAKDILENNELQRKRVKTPPLREVSRLRGNN